jgi:hypothetical protein
VTNVGLAYWANSIRASFSGWSRNAAGLWDGTLTLALPAR